MNLATLTAEGSDEALDSLKEALHLKPQKIWKKGDPKRRTGTHLSSGFSASIADAGNPRELIAALRSFLSRSKERGLSFLPKPDLSTELSVGVSVGDSPQYVACIEFLPSDLLLLGELGLTFSVWVYPTSDEANLDSV
jgi:hypothetical protein